MKKTLFIIIAALSMALITRGQDNYAPKNYLNIGGGAGFSNKNAIANVIVGYNSKMIGIEGSFIAHIDNINPALFNGQLVKSFYVGNTRLSLLGGVSYQITTVDKTGGTKTLPIFGLEWARIMTYHDVVVYVRGQVSGDNYCLMIGLSGIFKSNKN